MVNVQNFTFGLSGLSIAYTTNGDSKTINFDALATCDLLEQIGVIKGFNQEEKTNEPLVQSTKDLDPVVWCDFVRTFEFYKSYAESIARLTDDQSEFERASLFVEFL